MKMNAMHQFAMSKFATKQSRDDAMLEEIDMLQGKVKDLSAVLNHHKTLKAENAKLKAELEQWQRSVCDQGEVIENLKAELAAAQDDLAALRLFAANLNATHNATLKEMQITMRQELAAAKKDAERYRWATEHLRIGEFNNTTDDSNGFQDYSDEAIDAAMEAK